MSKERIALIPAYEPDENLVEFIQKIKNLGLQVVVVNDGSSEDKNYLFYEIKKDAIVLTHPHNLGKGRALKTGMCYIREHFTQNSVIVTADADGQHRIEDVKTVSEMAEKNRGCMILGSRSMAGDVPLRSRLGNTLTRWVYRIVTGVKVYDTQTGLRAFDSSMIEKFSMVSGERYEYEMNILLMCTRNKIPIKEVQIETVYINDNASSHFNAVKDSWKVYKEIIKFSISSFASFLVDFGVYAMLTVFTAGTGQSSLLISNVAARLISGIFNYTMSRKIVFKSEKSTWKSAAQYIALAMCILAGNTLMLDILVNICHANPYLGKIAVEIILFLMSWFVQSTVIFRRKEEMQYVK